MIVRLLNGVHYLIRQSDHARQSGEIAGALRPEFLGASPEERETVRQAIRDHDRGWDEYEARPRLLPSGIPVDFLHMDKSDHFAIWKRSTRIVYESWGAAAAVLIARHARRLLSDPLLSAYFQERERELAGEAWPGAEPQEAESRLERGYRALYLADLLSLIACDGWTGPRPARLSDARGGEIELTAWREGDWTVRVRPWPFEPPRIEDAGVEAIPIFAGEEPQIAGRLRENLPRARLRAIFLPADSPAA